VGLNSIIRSAVATADRVTKTLQDVVLHYAWTGTGIYGEPIYADAISRYALIEYQQRLYKLSDGQEILQKATVTFIGPISSNGASDRQEPIDSRDKIVLPNGYTGPIKQVNGIVDPSTSQPYMYAVVLG
jgi:hypothetical protein